MNSSERDTERVRPIVRDETGGPCPHLGLADDPGTSALYVRNDHRCGVPGTKMPSPDRAWQERYCLSGRHDQCPIYRAHALGENAKPIRRARRRWILWTALGILIALVLASGVAYAVQNGAMDTKAGASTSTADSRSGAPLGIASPTAPGGTNPAVAPTPSVVILVPPTAVAPATSTPAPRATPTASTVVTPSPQAEPTATPTPTPIPTLVPTTTPSPPASLTPTPVPGAERTHTVAPGETLSTIAAQYGVTVQQIVDLNHISNPDDIHSGVVLQIPPA